MFYTDVIRCGCVDIFVNLGLKKRSAFKRLYNRHCSDGELECTILFVGVKTRHQMYTIHLVFRVTKLPYT